MKAIFIYSVVLFLVRQCLAGADTNNSENKTDALDGKYLYGLGTKFNNPLLRLIGKAFLSNERQKLILQQNTSERLCELHPCTEWGNWSVCPATKARFAMVKRSRNCSKTDKCPQARPENLVTAESKVCEGPVECPASYETEGRYCLKLFTSKMAQPDSRVACKKDGGYLVHIDTKLKSDAVHALLNRHGYTSAIWIHGKRDTSGGPWTFEYGSEPDFDSWKGSEPSNGSDELCKVDEGSGTTRYWYDRACVRAYGYVCEITV